MGEFDADSEASGPLSRGYTRFQVVGWSQLRESPALHFQFLCSMRLSPAKSPLPIIFLAALGLAASAASADTLNVNAIVGKDGMSQIECWSLLPGFSISNQTGTVGSKQISLGLISNGSYTIFPIPGPIDAGLHNAPNPQWVITLAGQGKVTFPNSTESVDLLAGSIVIAVDIAGTSVQGHRTVWQGGSQVIQLPFPDGFIPPHNASDSICQPEPSGSVNLSSIWDQLYGLRAW